MLRGMLPIGLPVTNQIQADMTAVEASVKFCRTAPNASFREGLLYNKQTLATNSTLFYELILSLQFRKLISPEVLEWQKTAKSFEHVLHPFTALLHPE